MKVLIDGVEYFAGAAEDEHFLTCEAELSAALGTNGDVSWNDMIVMVKSQRSYLVALAQYDVAPESPIYRHVQGTRAEAIRCLNPHHF